jgi:hypothetical protein
MRRSILAKTLLLAAAAAPSLVACSASNENEEEELGLRSDAITSVEAKILDFTFDGELVADGTVTARKAVARQLLYTFGMLRKASNASGQIGNVGLTEVTETPQGAKKRIAYRASVPVAWPRNDTPPTSYQLVLPRDTTALSAFDDKYDGRCGKNDHGRENFWHDYDPRATGCSLDDADVVRPLAAVTERAESSDKYPEYDRIWEDDRLDAVAIFTIVTSNEPNDSGYSEARSFVDAARRQLQDVAVVANGKSASIHQDTTLTGTVVVGGRTRDVKVDVLVVGDIADAGPDFDERYGILSEPADIILYSGHARLGANTNALGLKGTVVPGKYQLVLLNACDSFALVDSTMTDRRREVNGIANDPSGTRFLDVISNAQYGYSNNLASVSYEVYKAVLGADTPVSYSQMLRALPENHAVVVYGEEDNTFEPKRSYRHESAAFKR